MTQMQRNLDERDNGLRDLAGQVALVTGAAGGIGYAIAEALARRGADVAIIDRAEQAQIDAAATDVAKLGVRVRGYRADVGDHTAMGDTVARVERDLGGISIAINNAASTIRKPLLELSPAEFDTTIRDVLYTVFNTTQHCARSMVARGQGGVIIYIGSPHAHIPFATSLSYNAGKAGAEQMIYTIAEELRIHRIRVNVVEPGLINTEGGRVGASEEALLESGKRLPWGRAGRPQDIARAVAFLCSPEAEYITAASLRVDGGFWLPSRNAFRPLERG